MDSFSRDGTTSLVISEDETLDFLEVSMPLKSVSDDEMRCIETLSFIEIHIVRHYPAKVLDISLVRPQIFNLFVRHYMENKTLPPFLVYLTGAINAEKLPLLSLRFATNMVEILQLASSIWYRSLVLRLQA